MANLWKADHESGAWLPDWSVAPSGTEADNWKIETRPPGGKAELGAKAIHYHRVNSTNWSIAPRVTFPTVLPEKFYGSFQVYPVLLPFAPTLYTLGSHLMNGYPLDGSSNNVGNGHFTLFWYYTPSTPAGKAAITIRLGKDASLISGPGRSETIEASIEVNLNEWSQVDFYCEYGNPGVVRIKLNCGAEAVSTGLATHPDGAVRRLVLTTNSGGLDEGWVDNFVLNATTGTINNNYPCLDPFPGTGFSGTEGAAIYPAPEALPHKISLSDLQGLDPVVAHRLQRKLQDNFDSIERQLLALDPDSEPNSRPER